MDILTIVVAILFLGLIVSWILLPGTSTMVAAQPENDAPVLLPSQQSI